MVKCQTLIVLDEFEHLSDNFLRSAKIIDFELDFAGKTVPFRVNVTAERARLADIVPLARAISSKMVSAVLENLDENGQFVPCRKGCSACCSYLVPLSIPEVFCLREELLAMPADFRINFLRPCLDAAEKILGNRPQTFCLDSISQSDQTNISQIGKWYAELKLDCPFLSNGSCSLYEQRPLACRENIVTSSAIACATDHGTGPDVVQIQVSILEALGLLTAELEQSDVEAAMLPLAFAWVEDNLHRSKVTWHAATMVERFVEIIKLMASNNFARPALST